MCIFRGGLAALGALTLSRIQPVVLIGTPGPRQMKDPTTRRSALEPTKDESLLIFDEAPVRAPQVCCSRLPFREPAKASVKECTIPNTFPHSLLVCETQTP